MKPCEGGSSSDEARAIIGGNYKNVSVVRRGLGIPLIYVPILFLPFAFINAYLSYFHLRLIGAKNIKTLSDFLPKRETHRYTYKTQIVMEPTFKWSPVRTKLYWILNCTWYCPLSVALYEWQTYLVKLVESWWCPFAHGKKCCYDNAKLDKSFWHIYPEDRVKLHPEDDKNPIWNDGKE